MNATTINSKDQNRINIFMTIAYELSEYQPGTAEYQRKVAAARLALYNMSIEAAEIAHSQYEAEFGKQWSYEV